MKGILATCLAPTSRHYKMGIYRIAALLFACCFVPSASVAQDIEETDTTAQNTKEVKNRNVMLNASSADKPRQINIGLPLGHSANIFEDGLPVSYSSWPDMPYFCWFGGTAYERTGVKSLSEGALTYGLLDYIVDSYHRHSTEKTSGIVNYQLNHFGRQALDATLTGKIGAGFGYLVNSHQIWDPGYAYLEAARLQNRTQVYKLGIDKTFSKGKGYMSLLYQYSRYTSTGSTFSPFIFKGDGSVEKLNDIDFATDAYYGNEASSFYYKDVVTGEVIKKNWKDAGTTDNHQLTFNLDYDFRGGQHLNVASKYKYGDVSMAKTSVTGILNNNGGYYYSDGTDFKGKYIQNRWMMYVPGYERSWLTTATLTGKTKDERHSWRIGANIWWNRAEVKQMNTIMAHEVKADPEQLYVKSDGKLVPYMGLNPGTGEYYNGHEVKTALFLSDDWQATKWLWMSIGARLEYLAYGGHGILNEKAGDKYNSRFIGFSLKDAMAANPQAGMKRFTGDWLNPSFTYLFRVKLAKGFGIEGEYVYVRQRPNLQDYAGSEMPVTSPVNINMARGGIYWNTPWMKLVSQISFITQTNYKNRTTFYNTTSTGAEESITIPVTNDVQTIGWTTDVVLTPFKGASLHALLTLQNPEYKKFHITGTFPSGADVDVNLNGNNVTAISKTLIELDPSYSWDKWRVWLSFRYFSKQYINKTNTLFFNGHWESFGGISFTLNKHINFALNVVNIFNQTGASGSISSADLITDTSAYKDYPMAGSYIRPFEVSLSTTIRF